MFTRNQIWSVALTAAFGCDIISVRSPKAALTRKNGNKGTADMDKIVEVVAALIWRGDRFLICRRPADKARGLLWEFAGGKVERGETKEQALVRECMEELAVTVVPDGIFCETVHEYPDITIRLTLFNCTLSRGNPRLTEHTEMKWITPAEIPFYDFCPADGEILKKIMNTKG